MKAALAVGFALAAGIYWSAAADPKAPEVGDWEVSLKPSGDNDKAQPYMDVLTLKEGKLQTKVNGKYGFSAGTYTKKAAGGSVDVSAVQESGEHGSAKWNLRFKGDELTGTLVWEKKQKSFKWQFSVTGKRM
jgi:hypothetical protein